MADQTLTLLQVGEDTTYPIKLIDNGDGTYSLSTAGSGAGGSVAAVLGAGSAIVGKVGIDQTTPGTTNKVVATHGKTLKTVSGSQSGDLANAIAAVTAKRLKIYSFYFSTAGTNLNTILIKSGTTTIWRVQLQAVAGIYACGMAVNPDAFIFATAAGEALNFDTDQSDTFTWALSYWDDDAS